MALHWERTVLDTGLPVTGNLGGCAYQGGSVQRLVLLNLTVDSRIWEFDGLLWKRCENTGLSWSYGTRLAAGPSGEIYALSYVYYWPVFEFAVRSQARAWTPLSVSGIPVDNQDGWEIVVDELNGLLIVVYFAGPFPGHLATVAYNISTGVWGTPFLGPVCEAKANFQLAFDRDRGKVIFYGGWNNNMDDPASGRLFELTGSTWAEITPSGASQPEARYGVGLCPDPERGGLMMFGGGRWFTYPGFRIFGGTWNLSPGNVWTPLHVGAEPVFTNVGGAGGEVAKVFYETAGALQHMTARNRFVTFGGESANSRFLGEPVDDDSEWRVMEYIADPPGPWPCPRCGPGGTVI